MFQFNPNILTISALVPFSLCNLPLITLQCLSLSLSFCPLFFFLSQCQMKINIHGRLWNLCRGLQKTCAGCMTENIDKGETVDSSLDCSRIMVVPCGWELTASSDLFLKIDIFRRAESIIGIYGSMNMTSYRQKCTSY